MNLKFQTAVIATAAALIFPSLSQASLLLGKLSTTGTVQITLGAINFISPPSTPGSGTIANPGTGTLHIDAPAAAQSGDFQALAGGSATIDNIQHVFAPVDTPISIPNFLLLTGVPNISFELTLLPSGIRGSAQCNSAPATGQLCTPNIPDLSPFNLENTSASSSTASFRVVGTEHDSLTGTSIGFTGLFAATFNDLPYQTLLNTVTSGGAVTTGFTATFTTVPEPGTVFQLASGAVLLGLCRFARRKIRKA